MNNQKSSPIILLLFLIFVSNFTKISAQSVQIGISGFGEPFCTGSLFQVTASAVISGVPQGWSLDSTNPYVWTADNANITSLGSSALVRFNDVASRDFIKLTVNFRRPDGVLVPSPATPRECQIRSLTGVNPVPAIANPTILSHCVNTVTLSIAQMKMPATDNTFADGYEWSVPTGWIPTSPGTFISANTFSTSWNVGFITFTIPTDCAEGDVVVRGINTCINSNKSNPLTFQVRRRSTLQPIIPSVSNYIASCDNVTPLTFTAPGLSCGTNFNWNVGNGWTILSGQGTSQITVRPNGTSGTSINVSAIACGNTLNYPVFNIDFTNQIGRLRFTNTQPLQCAATSRTYSVVSNFGSPNSFVWTLTGYNVSFSATSLLQTITTNVSNVVVYTPSTTNGFLMNLNCNTNNSCGGTSSTNIDTWVGVPYGTNPIRLIGMENPKYDTNGNLKVCSGSVLTFETDFDLLPNGADARVTAFEWDGATIVSQIDNLTNQDFSGTNTGTNPNPHITENEGDIGLKPRTSRVRISLPMTYSAAFVTLRVRLKNRCGPSSWVEYAILVTIDECYAGGTPVGPGRGPWYIIEPIAFKNPISSGRLKVRLTNIPGIDYNNLDGKTSAGFTYQIKLFNNQGDEKLIWEGDTVESDADVSFLQQGLYSAKVIFGNGQCIKNIHLIKE